jgi:hypothetical protein
MMMTEEIGDGIGGDHEGAWSDTMWDGRGRWSEGRIGMIGARIELMIQIIPGLDYTLSSIIQKPERAGFSHGGLVLLISI